MCPGFFGGSEKCCWPVLSQIRAAVEPACGGRNYRSDLSEYDSCHSNSATTADNGLAGGRRVQYSCIAILRVALECNLHVGGPGPPPGDCAEDRTMIDQQPPTGVCGTASFDDVSVAPHVSTTDHDDGVNATEAPMSAGSDVAEPERPTPTSHHRAPPPSAPQTASNTPTGIAHSTFGNLRDTYPNRTESAWPADFLEWTDITSKDQREKIPLWSPALYREGAVRRKGETTQGIETVTALVLDYDWKPEPDRAVTIERAREVWSNFEFVLHTTASHTPDAHRFRIVLPYSRPLTPAEHTWLWEKWALKYTGDKGASPDPISEPSRMFFIPTRRIDFEQGATAEHHEGERLQVDSIFDEIIGRPPPESSSPGYCEAPHVTASEKLCSDIVAALLKATEGKREKQPMFAGLQNSHEVEDLALIESKCAFMRHARDNAAKLPEPEWFAWLSIVGRCEDGKKLAHEIGSAHGGYSYDETQEKLKRAVVDAGPRGCENIRKLANACKDCPLGKPVGDVTSPLVLGRVAKSQTKPDAAPGDSAGSPDPTLAEDAAATVARLERALEELRKEHAAAQLETAKAKAEMDHQKWLAKQSAATPDPNYIDAVAKHVAARARVVLLGKAVTVAEKALATARKKACLLDELGDGKADDAVLKRLKMTEYGPKSTLVNVMNILQHDPKYAGKIKYNLFTERVELVNEGVRQPAAEHLDTDVNCDIQWRYSVEVSTNLVREAMYAAARQDEFHPVADYLRALTWDGVARLETLMQRGFGAVERASEGTDSTYLAEVGTKLCISAVARVLSPGSKVDTVVVLFGDQGKFKSTGLKALAGNDWFTDSIMQNVGDKDSIMQLQGAWFYELGELDSIKKAETSRVKAFISCVNDNFRPPYGHHTVRRPRQTVLVGTTNEEEFLSDPSGSRRFVPVSVNSVDLEWIKCNRDQLWAEAVVRYDKGEPWWYDVAAMVRLASASERFQENDVWSGMIVRFVAEGKKRIVSMDEILTIALLLPVGQLGRPTQTRVGKILKRLGFEVDREKSSKSRVRYYTAPSTLFDSAQDAQNGAKEEVTQGVSKLWGRNL